VAAPGQETQPSDDLSPAAGVLTTAAWDRRVVYDPVSLQIVVLNPTASRIWDACRDGVSADDVLAALRAQVLDPPADLSEQVGAFLEDLQERGLLGDRPGPEPTVDSWSDVPDGVARARPIPVLASAVEIVGESEVLVRRVADLFPAVASATEADGRLGIRGSDDDEAVHVVGWRSDRRVTTERFVDVVVGVLNQIATAERSMLALHASGVRSPGGQVVLTAAESGSGKSTLAAQMVAAGWDYLGDEAIGVRTAEDGGPVAVAYPKPLSLRPGGLAAVGLEGDADRLVRADEIRSDVEYVVGDGGPVVAVLLATYDADGPWSEERLEFDEAVTALAECSFNLADAGQVALDTLVDLATGVPVVQLRHDGGDDLVAAVTRLAAAPSAE
jgi:hypothetical protein